MSNGKGDRNRSANKAYWNRHKEIKWDKPKCISWLVPRDAEQEREDNASNTRK